MKPRRLNFVQRWFANTLKSIGMEDESFWSTWSPLGQTANKGDSDLHKQVGDGMSLDVLMIPVMWIARRMAESNIGVQMEDDETIDHEHPLAHILRRPNPFYAGSTMRMALAINYFIDGNAYLRKVRDPRGGVAGLTFIPSWCLEPVITLGTPYTEFYQYRPNLLINADPSMLIPATELVHLRFGIDPNFTRKGISPLKVLLRELYTDMQGALMTAMLMKNAGLMGVVISPKQGVTINKPTETKKYIDDSFTGVLSGKPMVMTAPTDFEYFGAEASKMDMGKLRNIPEGRVCALLNIPAAVVGMTSGIAQTKVGATLMELRAMAYEDCIIPTQNSWCDEIDLQLLPDFEGDPEAYSTQFDNSKVRVLQPDDNAISARLLARLLGGGITLEKYHEELGEDSDPSEDVYYIPNTVTITDPKELIPPPPPAPVIVAPGAKPPLNSNANAPDGQPTAIQGNNQVVRKTGLHGKARLTPLLALLQHRLARDEKRASHQWQPKLVNEFKSFGSKVGEHFKTEAERRSKILVGGNGHKADPRTSDEWMLIGTEAMAVAWQDRDMIGIANSYGGQYLDVTKMTFDTINATMGLGVNLTDWMQSAILKTSGRRLGLLDLHQETKDAMFKALEEARDEGLGADAMAKVIAQKVSAGPWNSVETRAQIIARTETKYAQNYSALEAYRSSETVTDVLVFDALLGPTDVDCEAINGETVGLEEAQVLMESEHPNGTRCFAPVVTGGRDVYNQGLANLEAE
jgi:HK97 family phage portal protein